MRKSNEFIFLLMAMILPVNMTARVVTSEEYNGEVWPHGYVCDFQVDSIFYTIQDNGVYVSAEKYLFGSKTLNDIAVNSSYHGTVIIPEKVLFGDTIYNVIGIDDAAFKRCFDLDSIYIPNTVKYIGAYAFDHCRNLRCLYLPDSLERIEYYAFNACSGLKLLSMPASVLYIDYSSFHGCIRIESLIWNNAYYSPNIVSRECCSFLRNVSLGDSIKTIGDSDFAGCPLTSITIPKNVKIIGGSSFLHCINLTKIVIEGTPVIYEHSFISCPKIDTIIFKSSIPPTYLDNSRTAYGPLDGFHEVFFDENVYYKAQLIIPDGSIDEYMSSRLWSFFSSLKTLYDADSDSGSKCDSIFYSVQENGDTIYFTMQEDGAYVSSRTISIDGFSSRYGFDGPLTPRDPMAGGQQPRNRVGTRSVPTEVNYNSFDNTPYRGFVEIPESVIINDGAHSVTGIKYYAFVGSKELEQVSIPESVNQLGYGSFAGCNGLKQVNIPSGVNEIPDALFYGCSSLSSIEIPSGVRTIGHSAFYECSSLTEIIIPAGVEMIDEYAFAHCTGLKRVVFAGTPIIAETAFFGCSPELEIIMTGVETIREKDSDSISDGSVHYGIDGRKIPADAPGLHIIKYKDGTVRKAVVR